MIDTFSKFYYGHNITRDNRFINIDEGAGEIAVELATGSYTLSEFASQVQTALNSFGTLSYSVSVDRSSRVITITADASFDLLVSTGTQVGQSAHSLMGFTGADRTGLLTYAGNAASGFEYKPQFKLQSYVPSENYEQGVSTVINKTADGAVEVVTFGRENFFEMEIKFITNLRMDGYVIKNNPNGLANAISFMQDITNKRRFEFMPDISDADSYYKVILESSAGFSDGTGFKLKELYDQSLKDIYETGILTMRVVN